MNYSDQDNTYELFSESDIQIRVTRAKFITHEITDYNTLFSGFDELRVITYSYGFDFIQEISQKFNYVEVIVGNDKLIEKRLAEVFANQQYNFDFAKILLNQKYVLDYIKTHNSLLQRVHDSTFHVYTPNDLISHQKIYLLKSNDGRYRTIISSANFSYAAWSNKQLEEFVYFEEAEAYEYFLSIYEILKELSTDEIGIPAFEAKTDEESFNELPISKIIKAKNSIVIKSEDKLQQEAMIRTNNLSNKIFDTLKNVKLKHDRQGNTLIDTQAIQVIYDQIKTQSASKTEPTYPKLTLDYINKTVNYNNEYFNLEPSREEVTENIKDIIKYFDSFNDCIEDQMNNETDLITLKRNYWKILNYMFLSPFLANFRYVVNQFDFDETIFPIYLLIIGESGIGKTTFIQSVQKLMLNKIPQKYVARNLKKGPFDSFKIKAHGLPILVDEMDNERWARIKNTVKADDFLIEQSYINHPCFIMPTNNVTYLESDIQRRVIFIKIDVRLDESQTAYKSREIKKLQKNFTNALYREYLRIMFTKVEDMIEEMKKKEPTEKWIPDIYQISSQTLHDIFNSSGIEVPPEFIKFNYDSYKGNSEKIENTRQILIDTYKANSEIFEVIKNRNILQIDFTCYNNDYRNKKNINILLRDLPRSLKCEQQGMKLIMNYSAFVEFTGIKIKKGLFF